MPKKRSKNSTAKRTVKKVVDKSFVDDNMETNDVVMKALVFGKQFSERTDPNRTFPSGSHQIEEESFDSKNLSSQIAHPPTDPLLWASAMEQSTRLFKSVHTFARNTVGLGWNIEPKEDVDLGDDAVKTEFDQEKKRLEELFDNPNTLMPFTTLMFLMKVDEEATGNGYIEIVRNMKGDVVQLFHVPSYTMRVLKGGTGFIQLRGSQKRYFKNFGDDRIIDSLSGEIKPGIQFKQQASEIIQFKVYCPRSAFYGIPRYVASGPAIGGNRMAATRNYNFFENDATPRLIISISGGSLDSESIKRVENFARQKVKNTKNAHRVLIMQVEPKRAGLGKETAPKVEVTPLTVGVTDDASFQKYREQNDDEVRQAFGISEVFFSMAGVNRSNAIIGRNITNQQEFEPDRLEKEYMINQTIVKSMGIKLAELKFTRPNLDDPESQSRINKSNADVGAITPNEMRVQLGLQPFPDDFVFANRPFKLALEQVRLGLLEAVTGEGKANVSTGTEAGEEDGNEDNENNEGEEVEEGEEGKKIDAMINDLVKLKKAWLQKKKDKNLRPEKAEEEFAALGGHNV